MQTFMVWAPRADAVSVQVDNKRYPLHRGKRGCWTGDVEDAQPGMDYGFILNDEDKAIPDPRSPWQPNGVNALSRLIDHSTFEWHDKLWQAPPLPNAVIYELHVGTFTPEGTFDSAIERLDYLKDLGITHIEVLPIASFDGDRGWGYDGVDLFAPHESYGGPDAVKRFVDAAHTRGLAVINDVVYNHFGPTGNYTGKFGPYITEDHKTPWGGAVNLEGEGSTDVRRFIIDNAFMWLRDYHFDGLRLDAVTAYIDRSAIHFLEQLSDAVKTLGAQIGKHFFLIAESDLNDPRVVRAKEAGGYGMEAQWSDDFHHALWTVLTGEQHDYYADFGSIEQLATALEEVYVYQGQYAEFRQRHHGRPVYDIPGYRFLGFIQNHDQVGNRALGDRLSDVVSAGKVKIGAALVLLAPFVPMLFQGEEYAASTPFLYFTNHHDKELGEAVTKGRQQEFAGYDWSHDEVPDPQNEKTFLRSKLNWSEISEPDHAEILDWYKKLITLRRSSPSFIDGDLHSTRACFDEEKKWLILTRGCFDVVCNFNEAPVDIPLHRKGRLVLGSEDKSCVEDKTARMKGEAVIILEAI